MKKFGIGRRLFAALLALTLIVSMVPSVWAATKGELANGTTGVDGNTLTDGVPIQWPIKVYDYLNDGMLFEYAQATHDTTDTALKYGGGMPHPITTSVIGNDYTVPGTYSENAYKKFYATTSSEYSRWRDASIETVKEQIAAVDDENPMYLHLEYPEWYSYKESNGTYTDNTKAYVWVSNFAQDNDQYYSKEEVRYAVIVYRTNDVYNTPREFTNTVTNTSGTYSGEGHAIRFYCSVATSAYSSNTVDITKSGSFTGYRTQDWTLAPSADWSYKVFDLSKQSNATDTQWSAISGDKVAGVRMVFPLCLKGEEMDISHIAYFSSSEEAAAFGEKAVVFDKDPGSYLPEHTVYTEGTEVAVSRPSTGDYNGMDFSVADNTTGGYAVDTYDTWTATPTYYQYLNYSVGGVSVTEVDGGERSYVSISNSKNTTDRSLFLWQYSGGGKLYYVTLVYKTTGFTSNQSIGLYVRNSVGGGSNMATTLADATKSATLAMSNDEWTTVTYAIADFNDGDYNSSTAYTQYGMYLPSCLTGSSNADKSLDIAMVWLSTNKSTAEAYGEQGAAYMNGETTTVTGSYTVPEKTWNMGNNAAFGMLFASGGGDWATNVGGGTSSDASNGYNSYSIGQEVQVGRFGLNDYRPDGLNNSIYMLYPGLSTAGAPFTGCDTDGNYDMSQLTFDGYKLFGTVKREGILTAGLIEPKLEITTDSNGNVTDRRIVYREETVDYIADLLSKSLVIPQYNASGNPNYNFVKGTANPNQFGTTNGKGNDLAQALRNCLGITFTAGQNKGSAPTLGDYDTTYAKRANLIGTFESCKAYITTCYDAAYYILNNLFIENSYNEVQDDYLYLQLENAQVGGKDMFVFDGGFTTNATAGTGTSAVDYNATTGIITNTSAAGKDMFYYQSGSTTTLYPFLPANDPNGNSAYRQSLTVGGTTNSTFTPYFDDDGALNLDTTQDTYVNRNFNYVMEANGEFVYHAEDDLYFEFEGDDDVYLFINGQLVLDIGGGHSITNVSFNMNDYVQAAKAAVAADTATDRDKALALQEGESYSFDFYYMERHGYGANCRIVTNIRITNPAMDVDKTAYQDGVEVPYDGIVGQDAPIEYGFSITNNGNSKLYNLSFTDDDIGLSLSYNEGLKITGTNGVTVTDVNGGTLEIADLVFYVDGFHEDGTPYETIKVTVSTEEELKQLLATLNAPGLQTEATGQTQSGEGLWVGSSIQVRGFAYKLTDTQKGADSFTNTVDVSAQTAKAQGTTLYGDDTHRVAIMSNPVMFYQWREKALYIRESVLAAEIIARNSDLSDELASIDNFSVKLCLANGTAWTYDDVSIGSSCVVTQYDTVGTYTFYASILNTSGAEITRIPIVIVVTDAVDSTVVLDYGIKADLTADGGIYANDTLTIPGVALEHKLMGITGTTPSYLGTFTDDTNKLRNLNRIDFTPDSDGVIAHSSGDGTYKTDGEKLYFTPSDFMDQAYDVYLAVTVYDETKYDGTAFTPSAIGSLNTSSSKTYDINNAQEVQMYQKVTVLPATVVYYEDDFAGMDYNDGDAMVNTGTNDNVAANKANDRFVHHGTGSGALTQGVSAGTPYGQDTVYQAGTNSDMSGNSLTTIKMSATDVYESEDDFEDNKVASFTFTGKGFEIISRTNAYDSATIIASVYNTSGTLVKRIPVITQFDNGDNGGAEEIYQVPVIRAEMDTFGTYTVKICGMVGYNILDKDNDGFAETFEPKDTYLYIDGVRIYQPMGATNDNYHVNENGAVFTELRDLIVQGYAAVAKYDGTGTTTYTGNQSWTENLNGAANGEVVDGVATWVGAQVSSVNDYLLVGPNNEAYMNGDTAYQAVIFYVKETGTGVHNLQVGIRRVDSSLFNGASTNGLAAKLMYGIKTDTGYSWDYLVQEFVSSTEQYYTIDYTKCPSTTSDGVTTYQVALYVESGMVSFSGLKYNGLEIQSAKIGESSDLTYENGIMYDENGRVLNAITGQPVATSLNLMCIDEQMRSLTQGNSGGSDDTETPGQGETGGNTGAETPDQGETGEINPGTGDSFVDVMDLTMIGLLAVLCMAAVVLSKKLLRF